MNEAPLLHKLQIVDLDIEETTQAIQTVEPQLGESEKLMAARESRDHLNDKLHKTGASLKEAEWDIEKFQSKIKPVETKLYGGTVKNPKELSSLEKEMEILRQQERKAEDVALEHMTELEDLQSEASKARAAYAAVEATWREQQEALQREKQRLSDHLTQAEQAKQALSAQISPASLQVYESLRRMRRGRAVATVVQNTCQGCRVALPMQEITRARTSPNLSFCSSCGRILLVTR